MSDATPTVSQRLETAARTGSSGACVLHLPGGTQRLDAATVYEMARVRAGRLEDAGVGPGTSVGVAGPNDREWIAWAHAVWMRGATLVPVPVPIRVRDPDATGAQLRALAAGFDCTYVAAHERFAELLPADLAIEWSDSGSRPSELVEPDPRSLAMVLPTSGSTAAPKGVPHSYAVVNGTKPAKIFNLQNHRAVRFLGYAPLAHGGGVLSLYSLAEPWFEFHNLAPERFARSPRDLFKVITDERITSTSAASSALDNALRALERDTTGIDLSSLRVFTFSFEMVDAEVVDRLLEIGVPLGLRSDSLITYYGSSEGGGTKTEFGASIRVLEIDLEELVENGRAVDAIEGRPSKRVASCGVPVRLAMRIAGPDGPLPEREVGEVQFEGRSLMPGYVGPGAEQAYTGTWLHTGDLGFVDRGELFVTGRVKEVIVQLGKKYHPEDIERAAAAGAGVEPSTCVAFAPADGEEGDVVVALEIDEQASSTGVTQAVRAAITNAVGVRVREIVLVAPQSLPKAPNGKTQRLATRDLYARGELPHDR